MAKYTPQDVKDLAQFMRRAKEDGKPFAFLTGSGCSRAAEIPDAPGLLRKLDQSHFGEALRHRLGCKSLSDCDYGEVMGTMPLNVRKGFLKPILDNAKVNWGHLALATVLKAEYVSHVLTFNFDNVLARAAGMCGFYPAIYDFGVSPATTFGHLARRSIIHLHGQGDGAMMKNTTRETEEHAKALRPLLRHVFENFGLLVTGYSGQSDKVFPVIAEAYQNENWLYWCEFDERQPPAHIDELIQKGGRAATFLCGVDFEGFMVELAQELDCFPPDVLVRPAKHLLVEINPLVEPPKQIPVAAPIMEGLKTRLAEWQKQEETTATAMQSDLLAGNPQEAAEKAQSADANEPGVNDMQAWTRILEGNALADLARSKGNDEALFREAMGKYEAALKIKPDKHEALNNWGVALADLAKAKGNDEALFREAMGKYEAALKIKPDDHEALYNWGVALDDLAEAKGNDEALFREAMGKYEAALKIKPDDHEALENLSTTLLNIFHRTKDRTLLAKAEDKARQAQGISGETSYNLGCVFAMQDKEADCQQQLLNCLKDGTLPNAAHLRDDQDLNAFWEKDWFKDLIARRGEK